jgi:YVTN family beta-propeller protein
MNARSAFGRVGWATISVILGAGLLAIPAAQASPANAAGIAVELGASAQLPAIVTVGQSPVAIADDSASNTVWVANAGDNTVTEIGADTRQVIATVALASQPASVAAGFGSVWVGSQTDNTVTQISETGATVVNTYHVGDASASPVLVSNAASYGVSVASGGDGNVWVIDLAKGILLGPYPAGGSPGGIALASGGWWVTDALGVTVNRVTPTASPTSIKVGSHPTQVAYDPLNSHVWVANQGDGTLSEISTLPLPARVVATYRAAVGKFAFALDLGLGTLLVADTTADKLSVFREATGQAMGTVPVGSGPDAVATVTAPADPDSVWVANKNDGTVTVLDPPVVTSAEPATLTATTGQSFSLQLTATGDPVPQFSARGLPTGLTISPSGLLSGRPAPDAGGTYTPLVEATNALGSSSWGEFVRLLVNQPPSFFTQDGGVTFSAGTWSSATVIAAGYPGPTVTESGRLPAGIALSTISYPDLNGTSAQLSGTAGKDSGGVYPIKLRAANSLGTVTKDYTITVDQLPSFTSPSRATFRAGRRGGFTIRTIGFPLVHLKVSGRLPTGLRLKIAGNGTATITGTPASSTRHRVYWIKVQAFNGLHAVARQVLTITIL